MLPVSWSSTLSTRGSRCVAYVTICDVGEDWGAGGGEEVGGEGDTDCCAFLAESKYSSVF